MSRSSDGPSSDGSKYHPGNIYAIFYPGIFPGTRRRTDEDLSEPSHAAALALIRRGIAGEVIMLNLLRLRDVADYSLCPALAPSEPVSSAEA